MTDPIREALSDELLPCPFCGGIAAFERRGTPRQSCVVACAECGARNESSDEGDRSGNAWNTRAALARPVDQASKIEQWFCQGKEANQESSCPYADGELAAHWWTRGYAYTARLIAGLPNTRPVDQPDGQTAIAPAPLSRDQLVRYLHNIGSNTWAIGIAEQAAAMLFDDGERAVGKGSVMTDDEALAIYEKTKLLVENPGDLGSYKRHIGLFARTILAAPQLPSVDQGAVPEWAQMHAQYAHDVLHKVRAMLSDRDEAWIDVGVAMTGLRNLYPAAPQPSGETE